MVEDIEELSPEAEIQLFGDVKLPLQGNIGLPSSETAKHIAPEIALLTGGRRSKRRWIVCLASGILRPIKHERHSWVYVWAKEQRDA